jgi:outer membrane protein OmpA-like peptidoglycan-associated protein
LWGLIPLAIVWWVAILAEHDGIEADLKARAQSALAANKLDWAAVHATGRDLLVTGSAADPKEQQDAAAIASQVWGVRVVDNRSGLVERALSTVWTAARGAKGIELSGTIPSQAARQAVLANVRTALPDQPVDDALRVARGVENAEQWLAGIKFALAQLAQLKSGRVEIVDGGLVVEGEAKDPSAYVALRTALAGGLPPGLALKSDNVTPAVVKPYAWAAALKGGRLELSGYAPSERQRDSVVALAKSVWPADNVVDRMSIAAGEPKGWQGAVGAMLAYLARMVEGRAELSDQDVRVSGLVDERSKADQIRAWLTSEMPATFKVAHNIELDPQAVAAEAARRSREAAAAADAIAEAARQAAAQEEAAREKAAAEEAAKRAATAEAERQKAAAATEADRQKAVAAAEAAKKLAEAEAAKAKAAEEAARAKAAEDAAKTKGAAADSTRQPPERAVVDRCQDLLSKAVRQGTINFKRASADIEPASHPTLNELARIATQCPDIEIDVIGHTDSEGTAERNQRLSERRASTVANYLADAGVARDRLHPIGFGDSQPIAPNDSAENMAKNRRIEFVVRAN